MCEESGDGMSFCSPCPADEPEKPEVSVQSSSVFSPDVKKFIEEAGLYHPAFLPDPNETVEALKAFLDGNEKAWKSKKKRLFDEPIDTGGLSIETWLEESVKRLLPVKEKYPESRHVFEGLGRIYWELYFHTRNEKYLEKAADAFIYLSALADLVRLDKYFSKLIKLSPDNYAIYHYYAKALSKLNDKRADEFFKKAISIRHEGHISPVVDYAEYLLDS